MPADSTSQADSSAHLAPGRRLSFSLAGNREDVVFQGSYDSLRELADSVEIGKAIGTWNEGASVKTTLPEGTSDTGASTSSETQCGYAKPFSVQLQRTNGNLGQLTVSFSQNLQCCFWTIDFAEVSKPIKTWHADKDEGGPDLADIRAWEENETANPALYWAFKKDAETDLEGETKSLAEMIASGIETYTLYLPVVTCTVNLASAPDLILGNIPGCISKPEAPNGWLDPNGLKASDIIGNLTNPITRKEYEWLLSSCKVSTTGDGSYQMVKCWQAADSIDKRLYGDSSSSSGGGTSSSGVGGGGTEGGEGGS